ncbi:MAG: hypothetical protein Q8941_10190 [Bacteroidota bacterium]|nr:hypothetical protein [Bacteroidota bacterium]
MQAVYRKLLEAEIRHDYFQLPVPGTHYPEDYNITDYISVNPSVETLKLMRDHKMIFKTTATGFTVYVQAEFISTAIGYATLVDVDPGLSLSFYWSLLDHRFVNYTNQRLRENEENIYYFSNRTASQQGGTRYLNQAIPAFGVTYPGEIAYHLGDIVSQGGQTFEMTDIESPAINFPANAAKWQSINAVVINYVNPFDRLPWQSVYYRHKRPNSSPGEFITYTMLNAEGIAVDLGFITGTNLPQSDYRAPLNAGDDVDNTLSFAHIKPGRYTLQITEGGGITALSFYLLNTTIQPGLFAVSEFFVSGAAAPFQFVTKNAALKRWILDDPAKNFLVRFRNRLTRWKYLRQDQSLFHQSPTPRPLTQAFSNYTIIVGGNTINLPDPSVDPIIPEIDVPTNLLKNIYSQIFLS